MVDLVVLDIQKGTEYVDYLQYNQVIVTIPNLLNYGIANESVLNFQSRLSYELNNIFYNTLIKISKDTDTINFIIRVYDSFNIKNVDYLEKTVNLLLKEFPFKSTPKKRKFFNFHEEYISHKVQKLNISIE